MTMTGEPLLTLEPLIEAVRDGVSDAGWELSGLQKTTSHEFEGRWEGQSSRSAYLFFHAARLPDFISIDVFLDETSKGLRGNLALVFEGPEASELGLLRDVLGALARVSEECIPAGYRTPIAVRVRMEDADVDPDDADTEIRLKLRIPGKALKAGAAAVSALVSSVVAAFEEALAHEDLARLLHTSE